MIEMTKRNNNTKMDWNALESCWAEQYEEDYGNLFSNKNINNHQVSISVSNSEAGLIVAA